MSTLTEEEKAARDKARAEHGTIGGLRTRDGDFVIVRKCTPAERTRFVTELSKRKEDPNVAEAHKGMAISVIVHPEDIKERDALLRRCPFLIEDATEMAVKISGASEIDLGND